MRDLSRSINLKKSVVCFFIKVRLLPCMCFENSGVLEATFGKHGTSNKSRTKAARIPMLAVA